MMSGRYGALIVWVWVFEGNTKGTSLAPPLRGYYHARGMQYLKNHGQRLDSEIAAATGIPLEQVRRDISALSAMGQITTCSVTRFNGDERFEGIQCRPATFIPPKSPGRKPGAQVKAAV